MHQAPPRAEALGFSTTILPSGGRALTAVPQPPPSDPARCTGLLVVAWPIAEGIGGLCERLQHVITTSGADVVVCDGQALPANCRAIEALARLQLTARRAHSAIHLQRPSPALQELLELAGLADVIPTTTAPAG